MTKPEETEESSETVGIFRSRRKSKRKEKQIRADRGSILDNDNSQSGADVTLKRKTLQELQKEGPPGFRKFELEVKWQTIDEDIALQLWEEVYKPLYTFD